MIQVQADQLEAILNDYAAEGWRCVSVVPAVWYTPGSSARLDAVLVTLERRR